VPYDSLYNKVGWREDSFFNFENICADLQTNEKNTMFLTACMFDGLSLVDGTMSH
jgi:hypothetical protein